MSPPDLQIRDRLISKMLLHGAITRRQICEGFGISHVAASKHMRWLAELGLIESDVQRIASVNRPVEMFRVCDAAATAVTLAATSTQLLGELIGSSGQVLGSWTTRLDGPTQRAFVAAMKASLARGREEAGRLNRGIDCLGVSVDGHVEPTSGMVFSVRGMRRWEPCHLGELLDLPDGCRVATWTAVSCKLLGLAQRQRNDESIGYLAMTERHTTLATMLRGQIHMGRFGSGGAWIHQSVGGAGRPCFCGRDDCFFMRLKHGSLTDELIRRALPPMLGQMNVRSLGVESPEYRPVIEAVAAQLGFEPVVAVDDPQVLNQQGLRTAAATTMIQQMTAQVADRPARRVIDPDAFHPDRQVAAVS